MSSLKNILVIFAVVSIAFASCSKMEPLKEAKFIETNDTDMNTKAMNTSGGIPDETGSGITDPDHDEDHDKDNTSLTK